MSASLQSPRRPREREEAVTRPRVERDPGAAGMLDARTLGWASVASAAAALIASSLGTGAAASLIAAALAPWVTAFITAPGRHRRRRVGAIVLLAGFLSGTRKALARAPRRRDPRARGARDARGAGAARRGGDDDDAAAAAARPRSRWAIVASSATISLAVAVICISLPEVVLGDALLADRALTFVPGGARSHRPPPPVVSGGPKLVVPTAGVVRTATSPRGARATFAVTATDTSGAPLTPDCRPASGSWFGVGRSAVACTATGRGGARATARFTVTVLPATAESRRDARRERRDTVAPEITLPAPITREATGPSGAAITYAVSAADRVDGALTPRCTPASGSLFAVGRTRVTCRVVDEAGNARTAGFLVTVVPRRSTEGTPGGAPRIDVPAALQRVTDDPDGVEVAYDVHGRDAAGARLRPSCVPASGSWFPVGTTLVRCSVTDAAGRTAAGRFPVAVRLSPDRAKPRIDAPASAEEVATSDAGAVVSFPASAFDRRDGRVPVRCSPPSGSVFRIGTRKAVCSATDAAGNVATAAVTVTVRRPETERPQPPDPGPDRTRPKLVVPADTVVVKPVTDNGAPIPDVVSATDDRDGPVTPRCQPGIGTWIAPGRSISVVCEASDRAGNTAQAKFAVRVEDSEEAACWECSAPDPGSDALRLRKQPWHPEPVPDADRVVEEGGDA